MKDVVFVTGSKDKAHRYGKMIGTKFDHFDLDQSEIQSTDLEKIAEHKARQAYKLVQRPVLVEDVGLFFNALGDLPGPFIKFFVQQPDGLIKLCRMLDGFSDRTAYTKIVICYFDGQTPTFFSGRHNGQIAALPRGEGGFGYDSIWCIDEFNGKTRAELTPEEDQMTYESIRPVDELRRFFSE